MHEPDAHLRRDVGEVKRGSGGSAAGAIRAATQENDEGDGKDRQQNNVYERAGGDAPEHGARTARRINERDPAERPQDDAVGDAAGLPAGQGVAELVKQNDREQRDVFERRPGLRIV